MGNQIFQCLIYPGLGIATLNFHVFAVHIVGCLFNSLFQFFHGSHFIPACFILLVTDDVLHGFRKLGYIPLLHILADLHSTFQRLVIRGV